MNKGLIYGALGVLALALVAAGLFVATRPTKMNHTTSTPAAQTGGQPVATIAGAAMAYAYNTAGSGYTITHIVSCDGAGPAYSCIYVVTDGTSQICGLMKFRLTRTGQLAVISAVNAPPAKCGAAA